MKCSSSVTRSGLVASQACVESVAGMKSESSSSKGSFAGALNDGVAAGTAVTAAIAGSTIFRGRPLGLLGAAVLSSIDFLLGGFLAGWGSEAVGLGQLASGQPF